MAFIACKNLSLKGANRGWKFLYDDVDKKGYDPENKNREEIQKITKAVQNVKLKLTQWHKIGILLERRKQQRIWVRLDPSRYMPSRNRCIDTVSLTDLINYFTCWMLY